MTYNFKESHIVELGNENKNCQLIFCATGNANSIKWALQELIRDIETHGKAIQGRILRGDTETEVRTPAWNGIEYKF